METNFKGTQGKWELSKPNDGSIIMKGNVRATVYPFSGQTGLLEEDKYNAKLISSAPDLLSFCEELDFELKEKGRSIDIPYWRMRLKILILDSTSLPELR